jgi:hypothetical protein
MVVPLSSILITTSGNNYATEKTMSQRFFNGASIFLRALNAPIWEHNTYIESKISTARVLRKLFSRIQKRI